MKKITRKVISKAAPEEKVSPPKEGRPVDEKSEETPYQKSKEDEAGSLREATPKAGEATPKAGEATPKAGEATPAPPDRGEPKAGEASKTKRACSFCQGKTNPSYTNIVVLRRFITDRAKIVSRIKDNLCSKHQRLVAREVKHARHLALLPFIPKV